MRVLNTYAHNKSNGAQRFYTRFIVVLKNLPIAEFILDSPLTKSLEQLTIDHFVGLYDQVGGAEVSKYISVGEQEFVAQYYSAKTDTLVFAFYRTNQESDLEESISLSYSHIAGGYNLKKTDYYDPEAPVPVLTYSSGGNLLIPREVKIFLPSPQAYDEPAKLFQVKDDTTVFAKNNNFNSQNFELIPESIYAKASDTILGIITPYDPSQVEIDTEPYCKILDEKYELRLNLWNSINKTEQYLLDNIFEGYNLSFVIEDPVDFSTEYEIFDTLQEMYKVEF